MGIRFFCPNGHRLHVKSFLAGKRGVCPDCGMGVDIPLKSDDKALTKKKGDAENPVDPAALAAILEDDPEIPLPPAQAPVIKPVAPVKSPLAPAPVAPSPIPSAVSPANKPTPAQPTPVSATATPVVKAVAPAMPVKTPIAEVKTPVTQVKAVVSMHTAPAPLTQTAQQPLSATVAASGVMNQATPINVAPVQPMVMPPVAPQPPMVAGDPISEAPMAIWYVRPSSGGQFGPARGEVMLKWLADGRVTSDSLVWREGWPDWRNASQVFPNLQSMGGINAPPASPLAEETPRRLTRPSRKSTSNFGVGVVVVLSLVAVTLVVALIYLLSK